MTGQDFTNVLKAYIEVSKLARENIVNPQLFIIKRYGLYASLEVNLFLLNNALRIIGESPNLLTFLVYVDNNYNLVLTLSEGRFKQEWKALVQQGKAFCYTEEDFEYSDCYTPGMTLEKFLENLSANPTDIQSDVLFMMDESYEETILSMFIGDVWGEHIDLLCDKLKDYLIQEGTGLFAHLLIGDRVEEDLSIYGLGEGEGILGVVAARSGNCLFNDGKNGAGIGYTTSTKRLNIGDIYLFPKETYSLVYEDNIYWLLEKEDLKWEDI